MSLAKKKTIIDIIIVLMCFIIIVILSSGKKMTNDFVSQIENSTKVETIKYQYVNNSGETIYIDRLFVIEKKTE